MVLYVIYFQRESEKSIKRKDVNEERIRELEKVLKKKREKWGENEKLSYFQEYDILYEDNIQFATSIEQLNEILLPLVKDGKSYLATKDTISSRFEGNDGGHIFWKQV